MIDVWGADHIGYIKRMQSAVNAITDGAGALGVKVCNLVKLMRGGEPVKMSKRAGSFVTLREVVDEVGKDAVRFMMLTRKERCALDFDFDVVKDKSRDNPVFYVQYAHARICSVLRNAAEAGFARTDIEDGALAKADLVHLKDAAELGLIRSMSHYPRMLASAAQARERTVSHFTDGFGGRVSCTCGIWARNALICASFKKMTATAHWHVWRLFGQRQR